MFDIEFEIKDALSEFDKPVSYREIIHAINDKGYGIVNAMSFHYHLKRLIEYGEVKKLTIGEELYYSLNE